jgi:protein subunit release factor A
MIPKNEIKIEKTKGPGKGGQRKNKVETACRMTHIPTGISVFGNKATQKQSQKFALKELTKKVESHKMEKRAAAKKSRRDHAIHNTKTIRTYDKKAGVVKDHRTGKTASYKDVLEKGKLDLLK